MESHLKRLRPRYTFYQLSRTALCDSSWICRLRLRTSSSPASPHKFERPARCLLLPGFGGGGSCEATPPPLPPEMQLISILMPPAAAVDAHAVAVYLQLACGLVKSLLRPRHLISYETLNKWKKPLTSVVGAMRTLSVQFYNPKTKSWGSSLPRHSGTS